MKDVLILGAGVSGLSAGMSLAEGGKDVTVIEKLDRVGGISTTFEHGSYRLDYGPHKIFPQIAGVEEKVKELLGDDLNEVPKRSRVILKDKFLEYPLNPKEILAKLGPATTFFSVASYVLASLKGVFKRRYSSYEDYVVSRFGSSLYKLIFKPYAEKIWGDPKTLSYVVAERRISFPSLSKTILHAITKKQDPKLSAVSFYYPRGGIVRLSEKMAEKIPNKVLFETAPTKIRLENNRVVEVDIRSKGKNQTVKPKYVVSSASLRDLVKIIEGAPREVVESAERLGYKPLLIVYLGLNRDRVMEESWIFTPERELVFNRLFEQKNFGPDMIPKGKTVLTVEITAGAEGLRNKGDEEIKNMVVPDLVRLGLIEEEEIEEVFTKRIERCYPVYDIKYKENLDRVVEYLNTIENLFTIGRDGLFSYNNIDHCMDMGMKVGEHIVSGKDRSSWLETSREFGSYKIVD